VTLTVPPLRYRIDDVRELDAIVHALLETDGGKAEAAGMLGISRATIYRKINTYGISVTPR
jgi:DNA-binding NtrC family response regulator